MKEILIMLIRAEVFYKRLCCTVFDILLQYRGGCVIPGRKKIRNPPRVNKSR